MAAKQGERPNNIRINEARPISPTRDPESPWWDSLRRGRYLDEASLASIHGSSDASRDIGQLQSGLQGAHVVFNKTRMLRYSHWMGVNKEVSSKQVHQYATLEYSLILYKFAIVTSCFIRATSESNGEPTPSAEVKELSDEMGNLLKECKLIGQSNKAWRPSRTLSSPEFGLAPNSREVADTMVNLYLRSFESSYRILHIPTFWVEYKGFWDRPESVKTNTRLKILLVIAIGSSLSHHGDTNAGFRDMVLHWVYAAQMWLSGPLEKDRLDTTGVQIHCLLLLARQIFSIGGDMAWISVGSLIHTAMQIGLHRDPKHLPAMSVLQAEIRRRLWATILEFILQTSLDTAMPPRISFDEFDTEAPSNINDDELDDSTTIPQSHPTSIYTQTSIQLILLKSLPIRLRILRTLSGLRSEYTYDEALALSSEICDIHRAYTNFMKENCNSRITAFHRNLLDYQVRRFMVPLHIPFVRRARTNPIFYYSLKVSFDLSMAMISPEPDEAFSHLMVRGNLLREGFRYATSIISLELLAEAEAQRLDGTLRRHSQYRELLKQSVRDIISLSADRIRRGEANVKNHMFMSMVLAQVEAMEEDLSCELKVSQSGRDSLLFCRDLLRAWERTTTSSNANNMGFGQSFNDGTEGFGLLDWDLDSFLPDATLN